MALSSEFANMDISRIPAMPPPPGEIPDFVNPESRAYGTVIALATITAVMLVFVLLRIYSKLFVVKNFGLDDSW